MSDKPSEYKPQINAAEAKVSAALRESINTIKALIARKNILYSADVADLDFKALEELGNDYKKASDVASKALSMRAQAEYMNTLDKSINKVNKSSELNEKLKKADSPQAQEEVMKEIEKELTTTE
tara:strand:- start:2792 stop:3166 length:375 start_codon:yes stop_codon:yes gene_type:complete